MPGMFTLPNPYGCPRVFPLHHAHHHGYCYQSQKREQNRFHIEPNYTGLYNQCQVSIPYIQDNLLSPDELHIVKFISSKGQAVT